MNIYHIKNLIVYANSRNYVILRNFTLFYTVSGNKSKKIDLKKRLHNIVSLANHVRAYHRRNPV